MKILFISGTFPPDTSATGMVLDKILSVLEARGVEVDALTLKSSFSQKDFVIHRHAGIYRVDAVKYLSHPIRCPKDFLQGVKNKLCRFFKRGGNPLYSESIVKKLVKKLSSMPLDDYDAVIAVCAYFDIAKAVLQANKEKLFPAKLYLYQLDPVFTASRLQVLGEEYLNRFEDELFAAFDSIFTTPAIYGEHISKGRPEEKMVPLEQPLSHAQTCIPVEKGRDEIRLVFAGEFYGGVRDVSFALDTFSALQNKRIHFYIIGGGQEELIEKYQKFPALNGRLHRIGRLPADRCDSWLASADILVNIGNRERIFVPSKLFHYLSFGRPILNLAEIEDCPTLPYLERYPLAKVLHKSTLSTAELQETEAWIERSAGQCLPYGKVTALYPAFTPQYITEKIIRAIEKNSEDDS